MQTSPIQKPLTLMGVAAVVIFALLTAGCMRYLTHERAEVLVQGVDIGQTIDIAQIEMAKGARGMSLTLWAMRDQKIEHQHAERVSELYFTYVDSTPGAFDTWHLSWAIANMYRHGNERVKHALQKAYEDAQIRAERTHGLADKHVNGEKLYMGDAHIGGRRYAQKHLVVPGNPDYIQSVEEYRRENVEQ